MYVYFDSTGTIKEIVNDDKIRQASDNANRLYFYFESSTSYTSISLILRYPDETNSNAYSLTNSSETLYFPETDKDLNYFVEGKQYTMYYYDLTSTDLAQSGTCLATVTCSTDSTAVVNGLLTFNVEESVILASTELTQSDLTYMLEQIASNNTVFVYGSGTTSTLGSSQDEDDPTTLGDRSIELGYGAKASGSYSNAIGQQAQATGNSANAIGSTARATGYGTIAIGEGIIVSGDNSCGIGNTATAGGDYASAMGDTAKASGDYSVAIGNEATATGEYSIAVGSATSYASGEASVAVGKNAYADGEDSIAIGTVATSTGTSSIGIGDNANVQGIQSIGIGNTATASSGYDVAIGYNADASGTSSIAIGREAVANNNYTIAVGYNSTASRYGAVAIGSATANNLYSNAVGFGAVSSSAYSTQIGEGTNSQANTLQFGNIVIADGSNNELEIDITSSVDTSTYVMTLNLIGKYYDSDTSAYTTKTISTTSIDLPLESTVVNGSYDSDNQKIILTLQSGSTIEIPLGDLVSGLQTQSVYLDGITSACENSSYTGFLYRNASDEIEIRTVNPSSVYVDTSVTNAITSSISSHPISSTTLGSGAIELGADTEASSTRALAIGYSATATASYSLAIGNGATASASDGLAIGDGAIASDSYALAIGSAEAKGEHSLAIGSEAIANYSSGDNGVAIGYQATAKADDTVAIGYGATANSSDAIAIGYNTSSSYNGVAIGYKAVASTGEAIQLGQGTNSTNSTLQFMDYTIADNSGNLYENSVALSNKYALIDTPSNPNLLINPDFSINQRGSSSYTGASSGWTYTVDRWRISGSSTTYDITNNLVTLSSSAFDQRITIPTYLQGKTMTASFNVSSYTGSLYLRVYDGTTVSESDEISSTGTTTLTFTVGDSATYLRIFMYGTGTFTPVYAKLELGSVATTFTPPLISEELPKCQRYYLKISAPITYTKFGYGDIVSTSSGDIMLNLVTNLRTSPTITYYGTINLYERITNVYSPITSAVLRNINNGNAVIRVTTSSTSYTTYYPCSIQSSSTSDYISLDAEIY